MYSSNQIKILIVEDETIIALDLRDRLEGANYVVVDVAISGDEAVQKAKQLSPTLVLMDIRLSGKTDGIEAAEAIWQQLQIPVVFVTGHSDQSTVERAIASSPFGYVLKPIRERELYVAIETAIQKYEREQWLRTILQNTQEAVIATDPHLTVEFINQVAVSLTGWSAAEAKGRSLTDLLHLVDETTREPVLDIFTPVLAQPPISPELDEMLLISRDQHYYPVATHISSIKDPFGHLTGFVLVMRDLTSQRLAVERNLAVERSRQLEQQNTELERINRLKDDFLSTISHEMRTPLANIKMAIHLLELSLQQKGMLASEDSTSSTSICRYIRVLSTQCNQEMRLIDDLLCLQRLDADAYRLDTIKLDLKNWFPHLLEGFFVRAEAERRHLRFEIADDLPFLVTDMSSLTRIVTELINNAFKYSPINSTIHVAVQAAPVQLSVEATDASELQVRVINTGSEIPPDQQERIFEPFYRLPGDDRWQHSGTGLGLALVKRLVTQLQGKIWVESTDQQTSFVIQLPWDLPKPH
ncbi:MAG TPA: response regulator [Leptolyngbyaceae cyanobacterium M33_DOE_097]|uniref:histidine kinase n=1 Tax=Oscillatoriales cyanobacterium SpSt-418 TaxID=2282169 RepID=A0A7C3KJ03_9CYAN|nr:response regulator [Leptolyngbyaceae cyanobacterium M33_DOE_097]